MNIDKYGVTFGGLSELPFTDYEYKQTKLYTSNINNIDKNSKVLEIGPGNGRFLLMLKKYYELSENNIFSVDLSKTIVDNLSKNNLTKKFNNNCGDTIEYLTSNNIRYDLIIMKHVLEHMDKEYIEKLVPVLLNSLSDKGVILIEVPNMANFPLGYAGFFVDFSHKTAFTDSSLKQAFVWNTDIELDFKFINLYIYILNYTSIFSFLKSLIVKVLYYTYCKCLKLFYNFANYDFKVTTTAILVIISKK